MKVPSPKLQAPKKHQTPDIYNKCALASFEVWKMEFFRVRERVTWSWRR